MSQVILVNDLDEEIGVMEKMQAHRLAKLHRAFSVFIFNSKGEMLLQQRADNKYHSAGLWTNACCSHPLPGEETISAASRRLEEELGFSTQLENVFTFMYRTEFENGLTENEIDHVFTGIYDGQISPDREEVKDFSFKPIAEIEKSLQTHPGQFTSWFVIAFPKMMAWMKTKNTNR